MASAAGESGANPAVASEEGEVLPSPLLSGYYASSEGSEGYISGPEEGESSRVVAAPAPLLPAEAAAAAVWSLAFGSVSQRGLDQRKGMQDTVSLRPSFCAWADGSPMHFFAVFDGHGGPQVSALCRDQMHVVLAEELAGAAAAYQKDHPEKDEEAEHRAWEVALKRSFEQADALGMGLSESGWPIMGSTAVVALLVRGSILVANCGDCRAVLCRAGNALPLSQDHKLERPDERVRVDAAGGKVRPSDDGQLRVRGVLAMSRALGQKLLKSAVICEPDITMTTRSEDDDCLILASDGLWDVIKNQIACNAVRNCLEFENKNNQGAPREGALIGQEEEVGCNNVATLLKNMAICKHSQDDISVAVLDLKARG
ncbi:hypothetical protein CFC21_106769 [Triticum aestivum]|uniref:protein-serine/threonine phosphatase n=3 Tax=Triticum aestivum TaxID=4565 RepID=A0A3B6THF4_WHEAT|nr:hypothetical protein CFC21_106769 [Triticum aestivum]